MHLELLTKQVCNLVRSAGGYIRDEALNIKKSGIEEKDRNQLVTHVDREVERRLIGDLSKLLPTAGFIVEEDSDVKKKEEFNWVIDPLDGTTNYVHGIPVFSISVALMQKQEIIIGVVYEVNQHECFYTWKDSPSYLNRNIIKVSDTESINQSLLATGFPYYDYSQLDEYMDLFRQLMKLTRGIRRIGSAAIDLAYVACGRFDGFFEYGLNSWDVAAGSLLVKNAGGVVTDFNGGEEYLFSKRIIASNVKIYNRFSEIVQKYLNN